MKHARMFISAGAIACAAGAAIGITSAQGDGQPPAFSIGGSAVTTQTDASQFALLQRTAGNHGLTLAASKTVKAPSAAERWTIAATADGGACAITPAPLVFCALTKTQLANGDGWADVYPPDELISVDEEAGAATAKASTKPGQRSGFAPADSTKVTVSIGGKTYSEAAVVNGLYEVKMPPQSERATVSFS